MKRSMFTKIAAVVMAVLTVLTLSFSISFAASGPETKDHMSAPPSPEEAGRSETPNGEQPFFVKFVSAMATRADFVVKPALLPDSSDLKNFLMPVC